MIEHDDYYCQVLDLTLSESERKDIFEIAHQNEYHAYQKEIDSTNDNNYYQEVKQLPDWFVEKAKRFLDIGHPIFLRNKGNVPWHTDDKKYGLKNENIKGLVFIIYLNDVFQGEFEAVRGSHLYYGQEHLAVGHKRFNESQELQLLHRGNSFLQNNQRYHSVRPNGEWRMFLQISFEQPYSEIRKML